MCFTELDRLRRAADLTGLKGNAGHLMLLQLHATSNHGFLVSANLINTHRTVHYSFNTAKLWVHAFCLHGGLQVTYKSGDERHALECWNMASRHDTADRLFAAACESNTNRTYFGSVRFGYLPSVVMSWARANLFNGTSLCEMVTIDAVRRRCASDVGFAVLFTHQHAEQALNKY